MSPPGTVPTRQQRFSVLYDSAHADVLRFIRRRADFDVAEDLTHEAFLIAWRRFDDVPLTKDAARAWLFGVARNCLLNDHRSRERYAQLGVRIANSTRSTSNLNPDAVTLQLDLITAWHLLSNSQQEVLSLALWEELPAVAAGKALGISASAYRIRLHRARNALRRSMDGTAPTPSLQPAHSTTEMPA
ncbi:RNA polymerase sigma factor [Leifsonia sp. A12D58]|uniref:RNA polymerase sigma factor n=1 Tax=Leifsonia sp. A12D58 TaxID=3397674 RepID=UPI0039E1019A